MKFVTDKVEKELILCVYTLLCHREPAQTRPGFYEFSDVKLIAGIVLRDNKTCV